MKHLQYMNVKGKMSQDPTKKKYIIFALLLKHNRDIDSLLIPGVKPHVCEECGKAFSRKMLLKQHARTHSGERPYACPHCDRRFADRSNMTLHLRLHTGVLLTFIIHI